jgi:cytochrome b subunit of formate dehydrogenase
MRSRWSAATRCLAVLAAVLALVAAPAHAQVSNDRCMTCHGSRTLGRESPGTGSVFVDESVIHGSAHKKVQCVECHKGVGVNHPPRLPEVQCNACHRAASDSVSVSAHGMARGSGTTCKKCHGRHEVTRAKKAGAEFCATCHSKVVEQYKNSVHGVARAEGDLEASTCRDCHGSLHTIRPVRDPLSPVNKTNLARTCAKCHADRQLVARRRITIPEAVQLFERSLHGRSKRPDRPSCDDCHGSHDLRRAGDDHSMVYRANIPATCGKCHKKELRAFEISVHGDGVRRGVTASPVCTDCHGEHMIRGPHDKDSPVAAGKVTETCARCHEAEGIRETFGLPAGRLSTYKDSFHGLAARGGSPAVANCASCHGYHDVLPSTDPRSMVSSARLAETCGKCHPGAGSKFRMGPVHVAEATPDQPVLYWTRFTYMWLIGMTIGYMLLHNGLDFTRKIGAHLSAQFRAAPVHQTHAAPSRWFERMTVLERIQHALLAVSFFTLVYTGFALKFPESWLFSWLARLEHGYEWRSLVHRIAAVVMTVVSLYHVVYLFTRRGRRLIRDLFPQLKDAVDIGVQLLWLLGLRKEPAKFDRFGYIEKLEYWALIWGTVVMTVTGVLLWFENESLQYLDKWALDLATLIHYYEAWLAFLAIVVWHLYANIVNPDVYPMNWTWLTGRISEHQLKHEHYLEWQRVAAPPADPAPPDDAPGPPPAPPADAPPAADEPPAKPAPE